MLLRKRVSKNDARKSSCLSSEVSNNTTERLKSRQGSTRSVLTTILRLCVCCGFLVVIGMVPASISQSALVNQNKETPLPVEFPSLRVPVWLENHHTGVIVTEDYTTSLFEKSPRFPRYGTEAFALQCGWTKQTKSMRNNNCTVFMRPSARWNEGLSAWTSCVAATFINAQQVGCRLILDYGPNVAVTNVLLPHTTVYYSDDEPLNWTVPSDHFQCTKSNNCRKWNTRLGPKATIVPNYRFTYRTNPYNLRNGNFTNLLQSMDISLETGMACAWERLFQLAPSAVMFEPLLFNTLLPTLRASPFAITLYIRTFQSDSDSDIEEVRLRELAKPIIDCALELEKQQLDDVVWMVSSDSPLLKVWIKETYATATRQVLATTSRGKHSKASRDPSTRDFAEAMIDWTLMGESDLIVTFETFTFGGTAAMRTARPYFQAQEGSCLRMTATNES